MSATVQFGRIEIPPYENPPSALPKRWPWLFRLFRNYAPKYAAKHLHAVRVSKVGTFPVELPGPTIMVMNHPTWWDPIIAFILSARWPDRLDFAPIEAAALQKYRFLEKVGLFGIETGTARGAKGFLATARSILSHSNATLWITAQGKFTDVRDRPVRLRSGVGHLAAGFGHGQVIPLTVEYPFWDERTPEALVYFGEPLDLGGHRNRPAREWTAAIERALESAQDALAVEAQTRDPARFDMLVAGKAGVGGVYDWGRRVKSWLRGKRFSAEHGTGPGAPPSWPRGGRDARAPTTT